MRDRPPCAIRRADHVGFSVVSLEAAIRFWVEGMGAQIVRRGELAGEFLAQVAGARDAEVQVAVVSLAGQNIELLEYSGVDRPAAPQRPFDPGFAHLALVVDDMDAVLARMAPHGWTPQGIPQAFASGPRAGTRLVYVVGPDGATIELVEPPAAAFEGAHSEAAG